MPQPKKKASRLRLGLETKLLLPFLVPLGLIPGAGVAVWLHPGLRAMCERHRLPIAAAIAAVIFAGAAMWAYARRLVGLLNRFRDVAKAVGGGDFSKRIARQSNDECGDLAAAFNWMSEDLQKSRLDLLKAADSLDNTRERLVQSEKLSAVGQLVAGVAHELNNPLAVVVGFSELLMEVETNEATRGHLDMVGKSANRCHKIVKNLLGFARVHAPERKFIRINDTLDEVVELLAYDLRASNVEVSKDYQSVLPPIKADQHQLQQIFVNLIGNARQAIEAFRPDGRITLRTRAAEGFVCVEVMDNGPGITKENIRRIFEPFFTTKPVGKGTGLGLSLVCEIIREHAGKIRVESEVGQGAMFVVELPISAEPVPFGADAPRARVWERRPAGSSGKVILVVDDEEWILTLARELLGAIGHAVETARDADTALGMLQSRNFDVIVCDRKMPRVSGVQFYERLVKMKPQMGQRVLFLSGEVADEEFLEFLRRSEKVCIDKPFPIDDFREAVEKILASTWSQAAKT